MLLLGLFAGCKPKPATTKSQQTQIDSLIQIQKKLQNEKDSIIAPPYRNDSGRTEYWNRSNF